jgi:hypothetical protein
MKMLLVQLFRYLKNLIFFSVQIDNTEPLHMWVLEYLMENDYLAGLTRIEVGTKVKPGRVLRTRKRRRLGNQDDKKLELHYYP